MQAFPHKRGKGKGKGKGDENNKGGGGGEGISAEVSRLARDLKHADDPDFLKKLLLESGWFTIRGLSKDGIRERDLKDVPREYRDLVRRYFLKLVEEKK